VKVLLGAALPAEGIVTVILPANTPADRAKFLKSLLLPEGVSKEILVRSVQPYFNSPFATTKTTIMLASPRCLLQVQEEFLECYELAILISEEKITSPIAHLRRVVKDKKPPSLADVPPKEIEHDPFGELKAFWEQLLTDLTDFL
jgi:hypothetical protein